MRLHDRYGQPVRKRWKHPMRRFSSQRLDGARPGMVWIDPRYFTNGEGFLPAVVEVAKPKHKRKAKAKCEQLLEGSQEPSIELYIKETLCQDFSVHGKDIVGICQDGGIDVMVVKQTSASLQYFNQVTGQGQTNLLPIQSHPLHQTVRLYTHYGQILFQENG